MFNLIQKILAPSSDAPLVGVPLVQGTERPRGNSTSGDSSVARRAQPAPTPSSESIQATRRRKSRQSLPNFRPMPGDEISMERQQDPFRDHNSVNVASGRMNKPHDAGKLRANSERPSQQTSDTSTRIQPTLSAKARKKSDGVPSIASSSASPPSRRSWNVSEPQKSYLGRQGADDRETMLDKAIGDRNGDPSSGGSSRRTHTPKGTKSWKPYIDTLPHSGDGRDDRVNRSLRRQPTPTGMSKPQNRRGDIERRPSLSNPLIAPIRGGGSSSITQNNSHGSDAEGSRDGTSTSGSPLRRTDSMSDYVGSKRSYIGLGGVSEASSSTSRTHVHFAPIQTGRDSDVRATVRPRQRHSLIPRSSDVGDTSITSSSSSLGNLTSSASFADLSQSVTARPPSNEDCPLYPRLSDWRVANVTAAFIRKLQYCKIQLHADGIDKLQANKRILLEELTGYLSRSRRQSVSCLVYMYSIDMFKANAFRDLPAPISHNRSGRDRPFDPTMDNRPDPAWPLLSLVFGFFLNFISREDFNPDEVEPYIDESFISNLLSLLNSEDERERDAVARLLHVLYEKVQSIRATTYKQINHILLGVMGDEPLHRGLPQCLAFHCHRITALREPLQPDDMTLLKRVLMPLHKSDSLQVYHEELIDCIVAFLEKDTALGEQVFSGLVRMWPRLSTKKQILFLDEVSRAFSVLPSVPVTAGYKGILTCLAGCLNHDESRLAASALSCFSNEHVTGLIVENGSTLLELFFVPLYNNLTSHWLYRAKEKDPGGGMNKAGESMRNRVELALGLLESIDDEKYKELVQVHGQGQPLVLEDRHTMDIDPPAVLPPTSNPIPVLSNPQQQSPFVWSIQTQPQDLNGMKNPESSDSPKRKRAFSDGIDVGNESFASFSAAITDGFDSSMESPRKRPRVYDDY